jgi:hypothetical protein
MDASLYFQLVDAVSSVTSPRDLVTVAERVRATRMHPLERRVLERALRARAEALDLHDQAVIRELGGGLPGGGGDTRSVRP